MSGFMAVCTCYGQSGEKHHRDDTDVNIFVTSVKLRIHYTVCIFVMEGPTGNILCSLRFWVFFFSGQLNQVALWEGLDHVSFCPSSLLTDRVS